MKRGRYYASPVLDIRIPLWRSRLVLILLTVGFGALVLKAMHVQGWSTEFLQREGDQRYDKYITMPATRGKIYDRTGKVVLASSVPVRAVSAEPRRMGAVSDDQLARLSALIGVPVADIRQRIADGSRSFVYLRRQLPVPQASQVAALGIPGIGVQPEMRRSYPEGEVMAQLVGFTDIEDQGIEGIELAFNEQLSGQSGRSRMVTDRLGRVVEEPEILAPPVDGQNIHLSIDSGIQFATYAALKAAMTEHRARAAAGVVIDVRTGEILALANLPSYDPNDRMARKGKVLRNQALVDTFEPGSIMKPFIVGLALDLGRITTETRFETGNGQYRYQGAVISDVRKNGVVNVADVLRYSSNIGMTMISEKLSSEEMWRSFDTLGFGREPAAGFPGVASGHLRPWKRWRPIERATMAYGYGLSTSLLQVAHAYTVFARNGDLVSLSLRHREGQPTSTQVFSPKVAAQVRGMLEAAAGPDGARLAQVRGYRVAGKSGTARKVVNGQYSTSRYRSSFVGFAPVSDPRIVVAITLDEPQAGAYYGGRVAAPVFANVVADSLRRLGVAPDQPAAPMVADAGNRRAQR